MLKIWAPLLGVVMLVFSCQKGAPQPTSAPAGNTDPLQSVTERAQKTPSFENLTALGLAYSRDGKHREALASFEQSLSASPASPLAYNNLCAEHNVLEEWDQAASLCRKAIELEPGFVLAKNNLAAAERGLSASDARIAGLKKNIAAGSGIDLNQVNLGLEYFHRGRTGEAISCWLQVSEKSPQFAVAQNDLASAYIISKQYEKARAALGNALRIEPGNTLFKNNERWLQASMGGK